MIIENPIVTTYTYFLDCVRMYLKLRIQIVNYRVEKFSLISAVSEALELITYEADKCLKKNKQNTTKL